MSRTLDEVNDFWELLERLSEIHAPLLLKKVNRIDNPASRIAIFKDYSHRANIAGKLSRLSLHQVQADRYLKRTERRNRRS